MITTAPEATIAYNKGCKYLESKKYEKALLAFRAAGKIQMFKELALNTGNIYRLLGQDSRAIEMYKIAANTTTPFHAGNYGEYPLALNNIGLMYYMHANDDKALEYYARAKAIDPKYYDCLWNTATSLLRKACSGEVELFESGWEHYEYRFLKTPPVQLKNGKPGLMNWDGSPTDSVIVMAEQGIGDNFMWGRYIPLLQRDVANVAVQCNKDMSLMFGTLGVTTCFHTDEVPTNIAIPMASLSRIYKEIPAGNWLSGYGATHDFDKTTYNVGIVHSGSASHANNHNRSINIHRFHPLAKYATLYSLSPDFEGSRYVKKLRIESWEDTVSYINGLDLVISVDTSIVHLCGALGKECWMLQPSKETDFRWGDDRMGFNNMWYESVRVFRNPNDWDFTFSQVTEALRERVYE